MTGSHLAGRAVHAALIFPSTASGRRPIKEHEAGLRGVHDTFKNVADCDEI